MEKGGEKEKGVEGDTREIFIKNKDILIELNYVIKLVLGNV